MIPVRRPFATAPVRYAVASAYFPFAEHPDRCGPVARPTALLGAVSVCGSSDHYVLSCYGADLDRRGNDYLVVELNGHAQHIAGCHKPTSLCISRLRLLPWDSAVFETGTHRTPILGGLDKSTTGSVRQFVSQLRAHMPELALCSPLLNSLLAPGAAGFERASLAQIADADALLVRHCTGRRKQGQRASFDVIQRRFVRALHAIAKV